jgi:hypothetical protein
VTEGPVIVQTIAGQASRKAPASALNDEAEACSGSHHGQAAHHDDLSATPNLAANKARVAARPQEALKKEGLKKEGLVQAA